MRLEINPKVPEDLTDFEAEIYLDIIEWIEELSETDADLAISLISGSFENAAQAYWDTHKTTEEDFAMTDLTKADVTLQLTIPLDSFLELTEKVLDDVDAVRSEDALTAALSELVANTRTLDANVDLNDYLYEDIEDEFEDSASLETQIVDIVSEIVALNEEYDDLVDTIDETELEYDNLNADPDEVDETLELLERELDETVAEYLEVSQILADLMNGPLNISRRDHTRRHAKLNG